MKWPQIKEIVKMAKHEQLIMFSCIMRTRIICRHLHVCMHILCACIMHLPGCDTHMTHITCIMCTCIMCTCICTCDTHSCTCMTCITHTCICIMHQHLHLSIHNIHHTSMQKTHIWHLNGCICRIFMNWIKHVKSINCTQITQIRC